MADAQTTDATSTDTTVGTTTTDTTTVPELGDAGKKALDEERRLRKDAEKRAKQNETELQKLRDANMNEVDKAIQTAKAEGRTEALREAGMGRVEDAVRAAAGGRPVDVDALLDGLDRTKFLGDDSQPDREAITAFIDRLAPAPTERGDGFKVPDLAQGTRGDNQQGLGSTELEKALVSKLGIPRS